MDLLRKAQRGHVGIERSEASSARQDELYRHAGSEFGPAIARLAASYEIDPALREDLLQDIHLAVWRSFAAYRGECALRTWVYRVAHNTAATHIQQQRRKGRHRYVGLEEVEQLPDGFDAESAVDASSALRKIQAIIRTLKPIDRDVLLLYLEGFKAKEIAEVIGISSSLVSQKVHRTRKLLKRNIRTGEPDAHSSRR